MKKIFFMLIFAAVLIFVNSACKDKDKLEVDLIYSATYDSDSGKSLFVRYYSISDGTLFFIKIKGLGAEEHTLPQAVFASGSRYTDFLNFECLVKGDEMQVLELDSDGNWESIFSGRERK